MPLLTRLQHAVTQNRLGFASTAFWTAVGVAVPTLVRIALDPLLGSTLWFPTYYPAALIGTLFLGWRAGLVLIVLSAVAANYFIVPTRHEFSLNAQEIAGTLVFLTADGVIVTAAGLLRTALVRLDAANQREKDLNTELQHRMKNTLAVIQGLVAQTAKRGTVDPGEFERILQGRLEALGNAHDLLSTGQWEACDLAQLTERTLAPFRNHGAITASGPDCVLRGEACVPLVLALHELATNAVKYGALSVAHGRVELIWDVASNFDDAVLLRWSEQGGPVVLEPRRRGLGSRLLRRQAGLEEVALRFNPEGVVCEITVQRATVDARGAALFRVARSISNGGASSPTGQVGCPRTQAYESGTQAPERRVHLIGQDADRLHGRNQDSYAAGCIAPAAQYGPTVTAF